MNNEEQSIEIKLSKLKLVLMLSGCIVFAILCLMFLGTIGVFLFAGISCIGIFFVWKIMDNSPGLVISKSGITDNSSGVSAGFIKWDDVQEIGVLTMGRQEVIMILVRNPEDYINRQTGFLKRKTMNANYKLFGSPISLSANALNCNFNDLKRLLESRFNQYQVSAVQ